MVEAQREVRDESPPWPSEWVRGVLPLLTLQALRRGPSYGYALGAAFEDYGFGEVRGNTLYPLLARHVSDGLVASEWRAGDAGPGRKFVTLTPVGHDRARAVTAEWASFVDLTRRFSTETRNSS